MPLMLICSILKSLGLGGVRGFESLSVEEVECEESDVGESREGDVEGAGGGEEREGRSLSVE